MTRFRFDFVFKLSLFSGFDDLVAGLYLRLGCLVFIGRDAKRYVTINVFK